MIAGGSVSGLLCAREVASRGHSVLVLERDAEIGTPQHCGGLISRAALDHMGINPPSRIFGSTIRVADIAAPDGTCTTLPAPGVVEIDRRELDKHIAIKAQEAGATIHTSTPFRARNGHTAKTGSGDMDYAVFVDARGLSSMGRGSHIIPSVQCEVHADWIDEGRIKVILDQVKYPGFFAWVIPTRKGWGKVGVAGRGINAREAAKSLLQDMGGGAVLRHITAPIWVGGAVSGFATSRNSLAVGDAAGQCKPTTGGGIYSGGVGGILAGQAISAHLESAAPLDYTKAWEEKFGAEFQAQTVIRRILERLDNRAINSLVSRIQPPDTYDGSFDFHAGIITRILGIKGVAGAAADITASEVRRIIDAIRPSNKV